MMRDFYEDNSEQKDIEDISSGRFDFENTGGELSQSQPAKSDKIQKPSHIPGVQPTVNFKNQSVPPAQQTYPQSAQPVYGQYPPVYYPQPGQPNQGMPDSYPVAQPQYAQYQQPAVYPQGMPVQYVQYGNVPPVQGVQYAQPVQPVQYGGMPNAYYGAPVQYQGVSHPQVNTPQKSQDTAPNPGTRVLYQSEDFERPESYSEDNEFYPQSTITHEDVVIEEEIVTTPNEKKKRMEPVIKRPPSSFTEDEMEIGAFELNALSLKHNSKVTVIKHKAAQNLPETSDVNLSEYEEYFKDYEAEDEAEIETKKNKKKKKVSTGEIVRRIVLAVSVIAIICAGAMLMKEYWLSKENDEVMQNVENMIIDVTQEVTEAKTTVATTKGNKKDDKTTTKKEQTTQPAVLTEQQQWEKIKEEYPNVVFPMNLQLKYAKLYAENSDFVGYLSAEGINMSLPIVQAQDDEEYLNKNFYGKKTKYGCPFVTHVNNIQPLDMNTVIFGHHMNNGTVFGALDEYKTIEGFKKAPVITFNTLNEDYSWKVIAAFITNSEKEDDNGYIFKYYFTSLSTTERYASYLNELSQRSLYDTGVDVLPTDKILTLSTCSHEFDDARFVVVARLVRKGESTDVDVSKASVNDNPRYPQAYYDKKNKENPYADAYRWEVG